MVEDKRTSHLKARRPGFETCSATWWLGDSELDTFLNNKSTNVLKGVMIPICMHIAHMELSGPIAAAISIPVSSGNAYNMSIIFPTSYICIYGLNSIHTKINHEKPVIILNYL